MASDLLQCLICPKTPTFSDTSHLLTHISSKGHLAHLHKLQVRSHQQIAAGHQLALYNQWFQQHGVAQLLSERLSQKETKRASKTAASQRRGATVVPANLKHESADENSKNLFLARTRPLMNRRSTNTIIHRRSVRRRPILNEDSTYTPLRRFSRRRQNALTPTPGIRTSSPRDCSGELNFSGVRSSPQLKGTVWPGMAMFDSAPEEMKRKRNQKKDLSVLRGIQKAASQVEPVEVVHSADGIVLKERHMDDMENDSLVEGESELMRPSPKKRRLYSCRTSGNVRRTTIKRKTSYKRGPRQVKSEQRTPLQEIAYGRDLERTSPTVGIRIQPSRLSPMVDDAIDCKLMAGDPNKGRRANHLVVFEDTSSSFDIDGSAENMPNPFLDMPGLGGSHLLSQLAYPPAHWPGNQGRSSQLYDSFKALRRGFPEGDCSFLASPDKENDINAINRSLPNDDDGHINPLFLNECSVSVEDSKPSILEEHRFGVAEYRHSSFGQLQTQFDHFSSATATAMDQLHHNPLSTYNLSPFHLVHGQYDIARYRPALFAP